MQSIQTSHCESVVKLDLASMGLGHNFLYWLTQFTHSVSAGAPQAMPADVESETKKLPNGDVWHFTNNPFCREKQRSGWGCFFKSITNCKTDDMSSLVENRDAVLRRVGIEIDQANPLGFARVGTKHKKSTQFVLYLAV